jgi:hypothetical protein
MKEVGKSIILIVLAIIISQSLVTIMWTYKSVDSYRKTALTGKASVGIVSFCINTPPSINLSGCDLNATQDQYFSCWLNITDPNKSNVTFSSQFTSINRSFNSMTDAVFNLSNDGHINFTPTNDDVGAYSVRFTVDDGFGCSNSENSSDWSFTAINVNDPPYLISEIPDQQYQSNVVLHAFFLDNYFGDPDLDPLHYTVGGNSKIAVTIMNSSEVVISASECDISEVVLFTAIDPYNATNTSNPVVIRCITQPATPSPSESSGTGGSGGGSIRRCMPEYECFDYHKCTVNNTKIQRCVDTKGCEDEHFITVPCLYEYINECNESWSCGSWGSCMPNSTQSRNCTDKNRCDTFELMPDVAKNCTYIGTCDDGIQNCHDSGCEENIDCGGPCNSCKSIQIPQPLKEAGGIGIYILTGIVLLLLAAILVYHYFKKEINEALAKAGWLLRRHKQKQILIGPEDKKKLLASLVDLEKKMGRLEPSDILSKHTELLRYYLVKACGPKLNAEFDQHALAEYLDKKNKNNKRITPVLRKIFISFFSSQQKISGDNILMTEQNMHLLIEELRNLVIQTSIIEPADIARETKENKIPEKSSRTEKIVWHIINTYIALEFVEVEICKKKYLAMLEEYEKLGIKEQESVFEHVTRLYNNISYVNSWAMPKQ